MSQMRRLIELKTVGIYTLVHFVDTSLMDEELIDDVGQTLYRLVDESGHHQLVLNLDEFEFYRSMFLASLIRLREKVRAVDGRLVLVHGSESFSHQTFEAAGVAKKLFVIYPTEAEALAEC